tara:strand:+ start:2854 stop:4656 length:1803 start_codon:yes stop_codon:yes gene_type:complete
LKRFSYSYTIVAPFILVVIFLVLITGYDFSKFEALVLDGFSGGLKPNNKYTVFYIDEKSDDFLGHRYPYSAKTFRVAIDNLISLNPNGISLVIDQGNYGKGDLKEFELMNQAFERFSGYTLVGELVDAGGVRSSFSRHLDVEKAITVVTTDENDFSRDGKVRRVVLDISGSASFVKVLAEKINKKQIYNVDGSFYVPEAEAKFSYTSYASDSKDIKFIPFHMLVTGTVNRKIVEGRNVLIGPSFKSNPEYFYKKQNGQNVSHLQLYVEQSESILQGKTFNIYKGNALFYLMIFASVFIFFLVLKFKPSISTAVFFLTIFILTLLVFILLKVNNIYFVVMEVLAAITATYYVTLPFKAISENKKAASLQRESEMKAELDELKNNFMNLMSHDLKTPIAKISSIVDNLKNNTSSLDLNGNLALIDQSTEELNKFISEILDISKIEAKKFNLQKSQRDLNKIIKSVVSKLNFFATNKKATISTELENLFPITLDENLIYRVVFNLLENAVKYGGERNNILIKTEDLGDFIQITIADTGPGIEPESLKYIFEKFYRVKNNENETIKGSGLGLYLVKYFIEAHGGDIDVESSVRGTIFKVRLQNI